jgi:predicted transglutaminase-like cysteine proteinase
MRKTGLTTLMALTCALIAQSFQAPRAHAGDTDARFLHFGAETEAPRGYSDMCRTQPDLCRSFANEPQPEAEPAGGTMCPLFVCLMPQPRQTDPWGLRPAQHPHSSPLSSRNANRPLCCTCSRCSA